MLLRKTAVLDKIGLAFCAVAFVGGAGPAAAAARPAEIFTVAGASEDFGAVRDGRPATSGYLRSWSPRVAALPDGGFAIGDSTSNFSGGIRRVGTDGVIRRVPGTSHAHIEVQDMATLPDGRLLLAEPGRVYALALNGRMTSLAGTGDPGFSGDGGQATAAEIEAYAVTVLPDGGFLLAGAGRVRRVGSDGVITTVAGTGRRGFSGDGGPATAARIDPWGVTALPAGGFLIAEDKRVRRVGPDGVITTVAGTGKRGFSGDGGPATAARIRAEGVEALPQGGFLLAEGHRVRHVGTDGRIQTVAGNGRTRWRLWWRGWGDGGPAIAADFALEDLAVLPDGGFLIADAHRVRLVPGPRTKLAGVAVREGSERASARRYSATVVASRPGRLTVDIRRGARLIRRARRPLSRAGSHRIAFNHRFRPGIHRVTITLTARSARAVHYRRPVLGGVLTDIVALRARHGMELGHNENPEGPNYLTRGCRRFSPRRVDCRMEHDGAEAGRFRCSYIVSLRLRGDSQVYARRYPCHPAGPQRQPRRWLGAPWVVEYSH